MKTIGKIIAGVGAVSSAYLGILAAIDHFLVDRKWEFPEGLKEAVSNADLSELKEAGEENMRKLNEIGYDKICMVNGRGQKLSAWLIEAEEKSDVFVLCAHGYRSDGRAEYCAIAQYYHAKGYNVVMVDHVASGDSEGNFVGFGYYEETDCIKWIDYLKKIYGEDIKLIVHGISMGAATVMMMSGNPELQSNVKLIVADCGYTSAMDEFSQKLKDMKLDKLPAILPIVNTMNKKLAGYDFRDVSPISSVRNAKVPMLFIHGGADLFVPTEMSERNYESCGSEIKDILIIDGADHAQSYIKNKDAYEAKINEFIEKLGI